MNTAIILDSSAFISLGTITDSNYQKAVEISNQIHVGNRQIVVPGDVFTEIINVVGKKENHKRAIIQGNLILSSQSFTIEETTPEIRQNAFGKFKKQPQSVSFTDCIVMALADHFETKDIFGFDESFSKNGYKRIGIDK